MTTAAERFATTGFGPENLPYASFSIAGGERRLGGLRRRQPGGGAGARRGGARCGSRGPRRRRAGRRGGRTGTHDARRSFGGRLRARAHAVVPDFVLTEANDDIKYDPAAPTEGLGKYEIVFFMNSTGDIFNDWRDIEADRRHPKKRFRPDSDSGYRLLAHEATHVLQQRTGEVNARAARHPAGPPPYAVPGVPQTDPLTGLRTANRLGRYRYRLFAEHLAHPLQPGERLGQLRADRNDLRHRANNERQIKRERDEVSDGHAPGEDFVAADDDGHDDRDDDGNDHGHDDRDDDGHDRRYDDGQSSTAAVNDTSW